MQNAKPLQNDFNSLWQMLDGFVKNRIVLVSTDEDDIPSMYDTAARIITQTPAATI